MADTATIAIVDDDKIYHVLTRKIIQSSEVADTILEFYDGQEALDYIVENKDKPEALPDLILLDIQMPFLDGWQFLNEYISLELPKVITIYIVSSSISTSDHEKSTQYTQVKGFLVKPFTRDKIADVLQEFKDLRNS